MTVDQRKMINKIIEHDLTKGTTQHKVITESVHMTKEREAKLLKMMQRQPDLAKSIILTSDHPTSYLDFNTFTHTLPMVTFRNEPVNNEVIGAVKPKQNTTRVNSSNKFVFDQRTNADSLVSYETNPSNVHPVRTVS